MWCDQDMITRLNIAVVLKEYKKDGSSLSMLAVIMGIWYQKPWLSFEKRTAASWYRIMISMRHVNEKTSVTRYVALKSIFHRYVDNGNSIFQVEDIHLTIET